MALKAHSHNGVVGGTRKSDPEIPTTAAMFTRAIFLVPVIFAQSAGRPWSSLLIVGELVGMTGGELVAEPKVAVGFRVSSLVVDRRLGKPPLSQRS